MKDAKKCECGTLNHHRAEYCWKCAERIPHQKQPAPSGAGSDAATCYASLLQDAAIAFAQAEHMEGLGEIGADEVSSAVAELLHAAHAYSEHNVKNNRSSKDAAQPEN